VPNLAEPLFVEPSWISLVPAVVTVALAFATRQVLLALLAGVATASAVLFLQTGAPGDLNPLRRFLLPLLASESFAPVLLVYLLCLGGVIGVWTKTGAALFFARRVRERHRGDSRSALFLAWLLGVVFHQGSSVGTVIAATTAKPASDPQRVSHEELAYVVDSTSGPAATLIPLNAWPVAVGAMLAGTIAPIPNAREGTLWFVAAIPFNFYAILAVASTLLFAFGLLPWIGASMRAAIARARTTGQLDAPDAEPVFLTEVEPGAGTPGYSPGLVDFLAPLAALVAVAGTPLVAAELARAGWLGTPWSAAVAAVQAWPTAPDTWLLEGFGAALLVAAAVPLARGLSLSQVLDGVVAGCRGMTSGALLLALAIALAAACKELQGAAYVAELIGDTLPLAALPAALMLVCAALSFAAGTWWGTYALVLPIAMPLAYELHADPAFVKVCFGAVIGGALYGDQCSPLSDSTVLAAMFSGADVMDHVRTQLPIATITALLAALASTVAALAVL
jgi:Na+/H+ antiporter NhaC